MQTRILDNLILENDDYIFAGNLTINGHVSITNGDLIVSGTLIFASFDATISIKGGNISALELSSNSSILIRDGDIYVHELDVDTSSHAVNINSDGDIEVKGDSFVGNVHCSNYYVDGSNSSNDIIAAQDIYILGYNYSRDITARDVFIGRDCCFNCFGISAKSFFCEGEISECIYLSVGK